MPLVGWNLPTALHWTRFQGIAAPPVRTGGDDVFCGEMSPRIEPPRPVFSPASLPLGTAAFLALFGWTAPGLSRLAGDSQDGKTSTFLILLAAGASLLGLPLFLRSLRKPDRP